MYLNVFLFLISSLKVSSTSLFIAWCTVAFQLVLDGGGGGGRGVLHNFRRGGDIISFNQVTDLVKPRGLQMVISWQAVASMSLSLFVHL